LDSRTTLELTFAALRACDTKIIQSSNHTNNRTYNDSGPTRLIEIDRLKIYTVE